RNAQQLNVPQESQPMHRRDFNLGILKASAAALFTPRTFARPLDSPTETASIAALYKNAIVIDSLCAPLTDMDAPPTAEMLATVRQSGITAVNFTISDQTFEGTIANISAVEMLVEQHPEAFLIVRLY